MDGGVVKNQDSFLVKIFAKISDASHDNITMNSSKATIRLQFIVLAYKAEDIQALATGTIQRNSLPFFLPSIRKIGGETKARFIKVVHLKCSLRCLLLEIVSCCLFLPILF